MEAEQALELEKQRLLEDSANQDKQAQLFQAEQTQATLQAQQAAALKEQKESAERKV